MNRYGVVAHHQKDAGSTSVRRRIGSLAPALIPLLFGACDSGGEGVTEPPPPPPANQPPVAAFTLSAAEGPAPLSVTFDASASTDPDGEITSWQWDFGDGAAGSGQVVTHDYTHPGFHFPRLTVTDNRGARDTRSDSVLVRAAPLGLGEGVIEGVVWHDTSGDGIRGSGDPPVPATLVWLDLDGNGVRSPSDPYTLTDFEGRFRFEGTPTGTPVTVSQELGLGWTSTFAGVVETGGGGGLTPPARVIGGTLAVPGEFPFMVALVAAHIPGNRNAFFCGGSFIASRWVLTAAHCVEQDPPATLRVLVGTLDLTEGGERVGVERIIIFPAYGANSFAGNDIALLELEREFRVPRSVLQRQGRPHLSAPGREATAAGWGRTTSQGQISDQLRRVDLPLISNARCQELLGNTIVDSTICAGTQGSTRSTCSGDSGGPLLVRDGGRWIQVGVTSFGTSTCQPPIAWARVSEFEGWIAQQVPREPSLTVTVSPVAGTPARVEFGNFR